MLGCDLDDAERSCSESSIFASVAHHRYERQHQQRQREGENIRATDLQPAHSISSPLPHQSAEGASTDSNPALAPIWFPPHRLLTANRFVSDHQV